MSTWYHQHLEQAAWRVEGIDSEDATLELWELLASGSQDLVRLGQLTAVVVAMPWNASVVEVFQAHGYQEGRGYPRGVSAGLLTALAGKGMGANPMPFPRPAFEPGVLSRRVTVVTQNGQQVFERVLDTGRGVGYGFVRQLQPCIYGRVRSGLELRLVNGIWQATGTLVAIKCIERTKYERMVESHAGRLNEDPIKEVAVMQFIATRGGARHVLGLVGCFADDQTVYVVLPFCPNGDLFAYVEERGGLPQPTAFAYFQQIIHGVEALHARGIAHHDMSLENIMLDADWCAVIIDFGMAVKTTPAQRSFLAPPRNAGNYFAVPLRARRGWPCRCGKLLYMAPELYEPRAPFDVFAADVWACGIILFLLLTGMPPYDPATGPTPADQRFVYVRDGRLRDLLRAWNIALPDTAVDLVQRLLTADPYARITIPELKRHPWWISNQPR